MFDVSFTELMVIGVIALIVIGPERLPKVAKTIGHLLGRAQRYVNDVKGDIRREIELDELRKFKSEMDEASQSVQSSLRETESALRAPGDQLRQVLDETARDARAGLDGTTPDVTPTVAGETSPTVGSESATSAGSLHAADSALAPVHSAASATPITPATPATPAATTSVTAATSSAASPPPVAPSISAPDAFPLSSTGTEPPPSTPDTPSETPRTQTQRNDDWPPPPTWMRP